jgi:hypothetical protein
MLKVLAKNPQLWTDGNMFMIDKIKEKMSEKASENADVQNPV